MAFRKRNVGLSSGRQIPSASSEQLKVNDGLQKRDTAPVAVPGVRPSPLDGRPTTSTGTLSLDGLLAGHAGLALGNSILIEESGTTDYAGTLLRYYAAEGVIQEHKVHVVGMPESWGRELPGMVGVADGNADREQERSAEKGKMKIAWRYERLGEFGQPTSRASPVSERDQSQEAAMAQDKTLPAFCHTYDLTKRLSLPSATAINFIPIRASSPTASPFTSIIQAMRQHLSATPTSSVHRLLIPSILSPAFYPPSSSMPQHILQFLHSLRSLLRQYPTRFSVMLSLPITLYPRETGLTRWIELLSDGVLELVPFPHTVDTGPSLSTSGAATAHEEKPQGMAKIHRLPVFHERGGGGGGSAGVGDDLAFTVTRKRFTIKPFSLPPMEGDNEAQRGEGEGKPTKVDIDF